MCFASLKHTKHCFVCSVQAHTCVVLLSLWVTGGLLKHAGVVSVAVLFWCIIGRVLAFYFFYDCVVQGLEAVFCYGYGVCDFCDAWAVAVIIYVVP